MGLLLIELRSRRARAIHVGEPREIAARGPDAPADPPLDDVIGRRGSSAAVPRQRCVPRGARVDALRGDAPAQICSANCAAAFSSGIRPTLGGSRIRVPASRFTSALGPEGARRVALDLSREMLTYRPTPASPRPSDASAPLDRVVGDAVAPPLADGAFGAVALLGNAVGFAGGDSERVIEAAERLVSPGDP